MAEDPDTTAAELALGVLDGEARAAALRRTLAEPAFAADVERWRARFGVMFAEWPDAVPGDAVSRRIAAIPRGERSSTAPWRWATALSSLAAAVSLALLLARPAAPPVPARAPVAPPAPLVAVLKPTAGEPFGAVFDPRTREMRWSATLTVPEQRAAELWTIGADGVPRAAGLLPAGRGGRVVLGRDVPMVPGITLAISIEPLGGSPKPTPTGPVIAAGTLALI